MPDLIKVDPRVHASEPVYRGSGKHHWRKDGTCSYCGSLDFREVMRLLRTPGSQFSGTDKTTYKIYVGDHRKFYFSHLEACSDEELKEFSELSRKVYGLAFDRHEGQIRCRYPKGGTFYGWQTYGHIGEDGEPVFAEGSPIPPGEDFWK